MTDDADSLRVLWWGLREYQWVVALVMLVSSVLAAVLLTRAADRYEAQAQVGPDGAIRLANLDALPRLGQAVFSNGVVEEKVRSSFDPPLPAAQGVVPERAELVAAQDNIVFTIIGRGPTPDAAQLAANSAAQAFTEEMNKYSRPVGSFAIQRIAAPPGQPLPKLDGVMAAAVGLAAGLVAGVGLVVLLVVSRRPVVGLRAAEQHVGAPVLGVVHLPPTARGAPGLPRLLRRLAATPNDAVLLIGPRNTRRARHELVTELVRAVAGQEALNEAGPRGRQRSDGNLPPTNGGRRRPFTLVLDASPAEITARPDTSLLLLVVREGTSQSVLRRYMEQYLDDGSTGVILVRRSGPWLLAPRPGKAASTSVKARVHVESPAADSGETDVSDSAGATLR